MGDEPLPVELPLFPLNAVLFPHMGLPLRVFEPRYRQMMAFCMERERTFGVVLIKSGSEVGEPAEPFNVGTVARIEEVKEQEDGTLAVSTVGVQRFLLREMLQNRPFQKGLVELLPADGSTVPAELVEEAGQLARHCLLHVLALNGEWVRQLDLPRDPEHLSYLIAARLPVEPLRKQQFLEAGDSTNRLRQELPLLVKQEQHLRGQVLERMWLRSTSLN